MVTGSESTAVLVLRALEIVRGRLYPALTNGMDRPWTTWMVSKQGMEEREGSTDITHNTTNDEKPDDDIHRFRQPVGIFADLAIDCDTAEKFATD